MRKIHDSPWQPLSIPSALTPIGQLAISPSPVPEFVICFPKVYFPPINAPGSLQKKAVQNQRTNAVGKSIGDGGRKFCDDACHASVMAAVGRLSSVIDEI